MLPDTYISVLRAIHDRLKATDIDWTLTGSTSFALQGIPVEPHDIDVQTSEAGAYEIEWLFPEYVTEKVTFSASERIRSHLGRLSIEGVEVEIMGAIQTRLGDGTWGPPVDVTCYRRFVEVEGMKLPVMPLEHEYQAYLNIGRAETAEILRRSIEAMMERKEPDQYGYTRYAVVLFAPEEHRRKVDAVRAQLPIPVAMIPAHVTVKGSFDSPEDLDEVRRRVREVAARTRPFAVGLLEIARGGGGVGYYVAISPAIRALHDALYDAIEPVTRNVYGAEAGDAFRPHMTVCQELPAEAVEEGKRLAETLDISKRFRVEAMCLMGLVGPRHGGQWEVVEEFPFTG